MITKVPSRANILFYSTCQPFNQLISGNQQEKQEPAHTSMGQQDKVGKHTLGLG